MLALFFSFEKRIALGYHNSTPFHLSLYLINMLEPEHYKGLIYIRISSLPAEQRKSIRAFCNQEKVIKIIRDNALINDCLLYDDYALWFKKHVLISKNTPDAAIEPARFVASIVQ